MARRSAGFVGGSLHWGTLAATLLCAAAIPLYTQEPPGERERKNVATHSNTDRASASAAMSGVREAPYSVNDVPYAVRVQHMFTHLAELSDYRGWATARGLDPTSSLVTGLATLAVEVERQYPTVATPEEMEAQEARYQGDEAGFLRWQRERWDHRYEAVGEAFGRWLKDQQEDGYPAEFLIERVVGSPAMAIAAASTDSQESLEDRLLQSAVAFEIGMASVMETVPQAFVAKAVDELRQEDR